jgi:hypothetical protein
MLTTFDLWMSRSSYDTFALVINFFNLSWIPCHISIGLFEAHDTFGATLIKQMKILLVEFNLKNKVIMYVKDEGTNLNFLTTTFISIVPCKLLQLPQPFVNICFGQIVSKVCQYVMNEAKVGVGMKEVSLKDAS